jgi:beta-phosphoglucomutase-like phosphatase (HAD superfamily)
LIHNLIWDFDGTILDSIRKMATSFAAFTARLGITIDADTAFRIRKKGEDDWRRYMEDISAKLRMRDDEFRESCLAYVLERDSAHGSWTIAGATTS